MNPNTQPETPWYTQAWFVILLLWFFFPVGVILMWTQTTWHAAVKWIVTLLPVLFILVAIVFSFSLAVEDDSDSDEGDVTIVTPVETFP